MDTQPAILRVNDVGVFQYITKPGTPPGWRGNSQWPSTYLKPRP